MQKMSPYSRCVLTFSLVDCFGLRREGLKVGLKVGFNRIQVLFTRIQGFVRGTYDRLDTKYHDNGKEILYGNAGNESQFEWRNKSCGGKNGSNAGKSTKPPWQNEIARRVGLIAAARTAALRIPRNFTSYVS